jgi:biopolymer transport protein ExbD
MSATVVDKPKPFINVTPLIDVLLVLLIIFMVVSPLKQARFAAKIPAERDKDERPLPPPDNMLVVTIAADHTLKLNALADMGTVEDIGKLSTKLTEVFALRTKNRAYSYEMLYRTDLPDVLRIQKTVFIKAPRSMNYGDVVKVIDGIKVAGATPIGLQLDDLN